MRHSVTVGLLGLDGYRRSQKPPFEWLPHTFDGSAVRVERAGARVAWQNTTVPGSTLTFDQKWLYIEGVVPEVWVERERVAVVRPVGRFPGFSTGVMFDTADGFYDGVIVWLFPKRRRGVLSRLAEMGWPVQPTSSPT